jgi:hypothetical protein
VTDINIDQFMAVRLNLKLDTTNGAFRAVFKTIDRRTGRVTDDPVAGFLPPNNAAGAGQGFLSFSIGLKTALPNGTQISNKVSIIFDKNDPITTNMWTNTIDRVNPDSRVITVKAKSDSSAMLFISGSDNQSGIEL